MEELKRCPFCGGEANLDELTPTPYNDQHSTYYSVGCINCGIGFYENTEQEAIAAWNRRADGWIPVGERVPDADEHMVLAIVNGKPQKNVTLHGAYMLAEYSEADGWIISEYPEWEKADVTHWMPLPAPPKGE